MEPIDMDDLVKKAVEDQEGNAFLSADKKNALWNNIKQENKPSALFFWKVACALLFLLSTVLVYSLSDAFNKKNALLVELANLESNAKAGQSARQEEETEMVSTTKKPQTIEKDTIIEKKVEYVYREKIVHKTIEKRVIVEVPSDSLLNEIALRDQQINELSKKAINKGSSTKRVQSNNIPMEVAFQQTTEAIQIKEQKEGKIKFQLSFINIK